jgi:hypothetical protein
MPQETSLNHLKINPRTYNKVINKLLEMVEKNDKRTGKLGGPGILVGVDETALNHKIQAHRGRAPRNKTDSCV